MDNEEVAQPTQEPEQLQDQQAEQAIEQAESVLVNRLDATLSNETKCVALLVRLALKAGLYAGLGYDQANDAHFAGIDLPAGQVAWVLSADETTWLEGVPLYDKPLEPISDDVKYQRVLAGV